MASKKEPSISEIDYSSDTFRVEDSLNKEDYMRVEPDVDQSAGKVRSKVEIAFNDFLANIPDELKHVVDRKKLKAIFNNAKSVRILVTGKTGCGKSTLVNGILGIDFQGTKAEVGIKISGPCTRNVTAYEAEKDGIKLTVWDSPGLQDGTGNSLYLQQMKEKCTERDLTMYCIKVNDTRFICSDDNPDVVAMKKLTEAFGLEFWKNAVIILTFSNYLIYEIDIEDLPKEDQISAINMRLKDWKQQIQKILIDFIKLDRKTVEKIQFIPAGHRKKPDLPVQKLWLSNLWFCCLDSIPSQEAKIAFVKANLSRFKETAQVKPEDFDKPIHEQPLAYDEKQVTKKVATVVGASLGGGAVGGAVGASIGIVGGPVGIVIGLTIGALFGSIGTAIGTSLSIF